MIEDDAENETGTINDQEAAWQRGLKMEMCSPEGFSGPPCETCLER